MLSFAATFLACALAGGQDNLVELDATQKLSIAWSRAAIQMIYAPVDPTPENYAGSLEVARAAAALDPNESEAWRIVLELADATSDGIPQARPAAIEAALQLSKLDPNDLVIRLLRLSDAVDRSVTAEDRIISYEHFYSRAPWQKFLRWWQVVCRLIIQTCFDGAGTKRLRCKSCAMPLRWTRHIQRPPRVWRRIKLNQPRHQELSPMLLWMRFWQIPLISRC